MDRRGPDSELERWYPELSSARAKSFSNRVIHSVNRNHLHVDAMQNAPQFPIMKGSWTQNNCAIFANQKIELISGVQLQVFANFFGDCRLAF